MCSKGIAKAIIRSPIYFIMVAFVMNSFLASANSMSGSTYDLIDIESQGESGTSQCLALLAESEQEGNNYCEDHVKKRMQLIANLTNLAMTSEINRVLRPNGKGSSPHAVAKDLREKGFGFFQISEEFPLPEFTEEWCEDDEYGKNSLRPEKFVPLDDDEQRKLLNFSALYFFGCVGEADCPIGWFSGDGRGLWKDDRLVLFLKNANKLVTLQGNWDIRSPWLAGFRMYLDGGAEEEGIKSDFWHTLYTLNIWIPYSGNKELAFPIGAIDREEDLEWEPLGSRLGANVKSSAIKRWNDAKELVRTDFSNTSNTRSFGIEYVESASNQSLPSSCWNRCQVPPQAALAFYSSSSDRESATQRTVPHAPVFAGIPSSCFEIMSADTRLIVLDLVDGITLSSNAGIIALMGSPHKLQ